MSNELSYTCPNCGGQMTYAAEHRGMSSTCPHCQNEVTLGGVARPPVATPAQKKSTIKERAKWWIITTHVVTSGFAMPVMAVIFGALLIGLLGLDGILAVLLMVLFNFIGYIGGTFYSLSYLKKSASTPDWSACTTPSIILAALITVGTVIFNHPYIIANIIVAILDMVAFGIITANGFAKLDEEN